jgi:hypothetical protein
LYLDSTTIAQSTEENSVPDPIQEIIVSSNNTIPSSADQTYVSTSSITIIPAGKHIKTIFIIKLNVYLIVF